jgi:membrane protease YdiL (CAAX protease family)
VFTEEPSTSQPPLSSDPGVIAEPHVVVPYERAPVVRNRELPWYRLLIAIGTWIVSVLLLVFVPLIVVVPYVVYVWRTRGLPNPQALATDKTLLLYSILGIVPTHLLTLLLVWVVVTEWRRRPFWKTVGFEWPASVGPVIGTVGCFLVAAALFGAGAMVTSRWGGSKTDLDVLVESSMAARFATAFIAVFTAPLVEELIYRGVLYSAIEQTLGRVIGFFAVSLLFAGVHVVQYKNNISVIVVITLLSFTLTFLRAYTGKLLPSFMVHLVFNGVQSVIIVLAPFFGWGK